MPLTVLEAVHVRLSQAVESKVIPIGIVWPSTDYVSKKGYVRSRFLTEGDVIVNLGFASARVWVDVEFEKSRGIACIDDAALA